MCKEILSLLIRTFSQVIFVMQAKTEENRPTSPISIDIIEIICSNLPFYYLAQGPKEFNAQYKKQENSIIGTIKKYYFKIANRRFVARQSDRCN